MGLDFVGPLVAQKSRVVAIDWRGCGNSDKTLSLPHSSNCTIRQRALHMLAVSHCLEIDRCHLATHFTPGLISTYMLLTQPERVDKVLALAPVGPMGLRLSPESLALLGALTASRERTRATLAPTLFRSETLTGRKPAFADYATSAQKRVFERLVDRTSGMSERIWFSIAAKFDRNWGAWELANCGLTSRPFDSGI